MATTPHNPVTTKFHGHVGPFIYYVVHNQQRIRTMPSAVRNPRTDDQVAHRTQFASANTIAAIFKNIYKLGYHNNQQTGRNGIPLDPRAAFAKHIYHDALDEHYRLDPTKLILSQGTLPQFKPLDVNVSPTQISLRWSISGGSPIDRLCVVLYNYTRNQATFLQDIVSRQERHTTVTIPSNSQHDHIYIYCFWHNPENTDPRNSHKNIKVSKSLLVAQLNNPNDESSKKLDLQQHLYHLTAPWQTKFRKQLNLIPPSAEHLHNSKFEIHNSNDTPPS